MRRKNIKRRISFADGSCVPAYTFSRLPMRERAFRVNISVQFIVDDRCEVAGAARFQHRVELAARETRKASRVPRIFRPIFAKLFDLLVLKNICGSRDFKQRRTSAHRAKTAPKYGASEKIGSWELRERYALVDRGNLDCWHVASIDSYLLRRFSLSKQSIKIKPLESAMRFISA